MVKLCGNVEFRADFPDDPEHDDETQVAAGNVAKALAEALTRIGYEVGALEDCFEQGWEFDARREGSRFWLRVTEIDEFVLMTKDMTFRLSAKLAPYAAFLRDLHSALASDARFEHIKWFRDDLPADGGAWQAEPVVA
jgi:hypothetical protein